MRWHTLRRMRTSISKDGRQLDADELSSNIGTFAHATFEQGDADGDADVDGDDFLAWQREIGAARPQRVRQHFVRGFVAQLQRGAGTNRDGTSVGYCIITRFSSATMSRHSPVAQSIQNTSVARTAARLPVRLGACLYSATFSFD